ncbi:MAG: hypothetical protein ABIQ86_01420 [Steroidobacteraceae bacterium]
MDIKSFAGWCVGPSGGPTDFRPGRQFARLHTATAQQMELSRTVPTLIAWVSCIVSPTKGKNLNQSNQLVAALRATTYCLTQV